MNKNNEGREFSEKRKISACGLSSMVTNPWTKKKEEEGGEEEKGSGNNKYQAHLHFRETAARFEMGPDNSLQGSNKRFDSEHPRI